MALDLHRIEREIRDDLPVYVEALRQLVAIDSGSSSPEGVAISHERKVWDLSACTAPARTEWPLPPVRGSTLLRQGSTGRQPTC